MILIAHLNTVQTIVQVMETVIMPLEFAYAMRIKQYFFFNKIQQSIKILKINKKNFNKIKKLD